MKKLRVAINGFGRIGRLAARRILETDSLQLAAINDLTDTATLRTLFKYDSAHGKFPGVVEHTNDSLTFDGNQVSVSALRNPAELAWKEKEIDLVLECTGFFRDKEKAGLHLDAGAKRVLISAPAKGDVKTIVLGVNDNQLTKDDLILSNASCTTNCLAPMVKVLNNALGIEQGYITTIHAYTSDQRIQDAPHSDLRRARAAAQNIVPTSTGAAVAVGKVLPEIAGKLTGFALRVPVIDGSITDLTCSVSRETSIEEINELFENASRNELKGILEFNTDPIVSSDIVGNTHSCIFDAPLTQANGKLVKIVGWYDNEYGYASRLVQLAQRVGEMI